MIRKIVMYVLLTLTALGIYAQELPALPEIVPASPEAASLGKYVDVPVSLSTGIPNISIPILELKGKSINIPITLSYHASGIKVNEVSSRNGLGWSINTGGMITRSMRGIPDDELEGYINTSNTVQNYENANSAQKEELSLLALDRSIEYESDIYYFNFLGNSGKFFFNQNNDEIIIHPKNDLKVSYTQDSDSKIIGWQIITKEGIIFEFGNDVNSINRETNTSYVKGQQLPIFDPYSFNRIHGWYLTKIIDTLGNTITYTYNKGQDEITLWNLTSNDKEFHSIGSSGVGTFPTTETTMFSKKEYMPIFLTKIESSFGELLFDYAHYREDLINDKALTSVRLLDNNGSLVDEYSFEYDYFISTDTNQHPDFGIDDQLKKRLYLEKVVQKKNTSTNKEYILEYDITHILPNRFSYSQDFWGFYNGRDNNVLYPQTEVRTQNNIITIEGADRTVDVNYVKACTLKSITHPTKGKTEFLFESNTIGRTDNEAFYIGNRYQNSPIPGGQLGNEIGVGNEGRIFDNPF